MNLNELNKEMFNLQNEFAKSNLKDINFQDVKQTIDTTQIKRPTKSGDHRNDINEKMTMLNTNYFHSEITNPNSPDMLNNQSIMNYQATRNNNTNYANTITNLQPGQAPTKDSHLQVIIIIILKHYNQPHHLNKVNQL